MWGDGAAGEGKKKAFEAPAHRLFSESAMERKQRSSLLHYPVVIFKIMYMCVWAPFRLLVIVFLRSDPMNCLKLPEGGEQSYGKSVAMSTPVDLARIKRISKTVGGTVNDVIVACTAISLRSHMLARFGQDESKIPK